MNVKLKPCPFCGGKADIGTARRPIGNVFVYCTNCGSATQAFDDDDYEGEKEVWIDGLPYYQRSKTKTQKATIAWNKRISNKERD